VTISTDSISGSGLNASGASGVVLTPGQSTTLSVTFTPASAGNVSGSLTIASNASNSSLSIALSGTGVQPPPTTYSVALTWNNSNSAGIVGYDVFRGTVQGGPYTQLTSSPIAGTTYTDTSAQAGQTYYYAVTSVNSSNVQSSYSNVANVNVP
jgi:fibronectin type 3 domain-containing protein